MNSRTRLAIIAVAGVVLIIGGGCAATALRVGAAGFGRAVVGSAVRSSAGVAIGGRMVAAGALRTGLRGLTAGRSAPAVVSITRSGSILHRGRTLASIESDGLLVAREGGREYVVGRMMQNRLWAFTEAGELTPVARLRGFVPSRGIAVRSAPSSGAPRVEILRGNVTAEVLQVRDGWYEIRLPNQTTGWLWGSLLALAIIEDDNSDEAPTLEDATNVLVVLQNGQSLRAREITVEPGVVHVWDERGSAYTFDRSVVSRTVPLRELPEIDDAPLVELTDGTSVVGTARRLESGAIAIDATSGSTVIVDATLVDDPPLADTVQEAAAAPNEAWRSRNTW